MGPRVSAPRVFVLAGEPSGDKLGGALMAGLKQLEPDTDFCGIGGPEMTTQGLLSLFPMSELSLMGIWEILPQYRAEPMPVSLIYPHRRNLSRRVHLFMEWLATVLKDYVDH